MSELGRTARFLVLTHVVHTVNAHGVHAYGPYVREMNLWFEAVERVTIVAPCRRGDASAIEQRMVHSHLRLVHIPSISIISFRSTIRALALLPWIVVRILVEMTRADHYHLRCPGNVGFISIVFQRLFPWKKKTVKYAGNWDPGADDERTVRWQKRLLRSPWWCRNTSVLVYGEWQSMPPHVISFFTASFSDRVPVVPPRSVTDGPIRLVFIGAIEEGKRPGMVIEVLSHLRADGIDAELTLLGDGTLRQMLEARVMDLGLGNYVRFLGAVSEAQVCDELTWCHFVLLLSRTEGWPKAIAEAMFFGAVPVGLRVSCVPWMLGEGRRGVLAPAEPVVIGREIAALIRDPGRYREMALEATAWSREYTLERMRRAVAGFV